MKRIFTVLLLISSLSGFAQAIGDGKSTLSKIARREDGFLVHITSDGWMSVPAGIKLKPFSSRGFAFFFMGESMNKTERIGIGYGIGLTSQNVGSNGFFDDQSDQTKTLLTKIADSTDFSINKLSLNTLDVTLEFRFRTAANSKNRHFKISAGIKGGLLIQDHTKYKDDHTKIKSYRLEHLSPFQYGITGRIGYGKWAVGGYYALAEIFKKDKGPDLVPYSIGITLTP